jgi:hypothetical protein
VCTRENNNYYKIIKGETQQKSNLSEEAVDHGFTFGVHIEHLPLL